MPMTTVTASAMFARDDREGARVVHHLLLVGLEARRQRLFQRDGLGRNDMHERPALEAREHRLVHCLGMLGLELHSGRQRGVDVEAALEYQVRAVLLLQELLY